MSHMVIYRGADGKPGYHQTEEIHDAVAFVEELRNSQGVEEARIFRMEEVRFEYQPYFRVQIAEGGSALRAAAPTPQVAATSTPTPMPTVSQPAEAPSAAPAAAPVITAPAAAAPAASEPSAQPAPNGQSDSENGVGARRGLFGR